MSAEYSAFREFKVKWRRSCGWAEFEVSDYMNDAPLSVLSGVAETIFFPDIKTFEKRISEGDA